MMRYVTNFERAIDDEWTDKVKRILKAEIARRHLTYADIVAKLAELGVKETDVNIRDKISRGGFYSGVLR